MKYLYFLSLLFLVGCNPTANIITSPMTENFPKDWIGNWSGTLQIYKENTLTQSIPMQLKIHPIDSSNKYTWAITYGEGDKASTRPYELIPIDAEKGHYQTDEKNGIFLDAYYMGGVLYSRFLVQDNLLMVTTQKQGDQLIYDIVVGDIKNTMETGNDKKNKIPLVTSYKLTTKQHALLSKK